MIETSLCPIVTVTCERDLSLLELQAQSFDRFLYENSEIIIVVNEKDPSKWKDFYQKNIEKWYKRHSVKIYYHSDFDINWNLFIKNDQVTGWVRQQILKLAVSNKLNSPAYLILDSQNFLVNFWSFKNKIIENKIPYKPGKLEWAEIPYKNYQLFFDPSANHKGFLNTSISTPFFIKTELAQQLVNSFGGNLKFSKWFFDYSDIKSEFALYTAWITVNDYTEKYHYETKNWIHPMLRDSVNFNQDVEYYLENVGKYTPHRWSSINFRAWLNMSPEQFKKINDKLNEFRLFPNVGKFREEYRDPY
jgi:hypothetical protein